MLYQVLWHEEREFARAEPQLQQGRAQAAKAGTEEDNDIFINTQKEFREKSYELPCLQELLLAQKNLDPGISCLGF